MKCQPKLITTLALLGSPLPDAPQIISDRGVIIILGIFAALAAVVIAVVLKFFRRSQ